MLLASVTSTGLFAFADPAITESSGLVDSGRVVYTVNDSGAAPILYAVDPRTGRTQGTTTFSPDPVVDVEALAPAGDGDVWVADIGDNLRVRDIVSLYRVTPGESQATRVDLTYPGGPRDAETLLADPRTGRLYVVSKTIFGGVVYAAPRRLDPDRPNRLLRVGEVPGFLTDGAVLPDGRHVLLRGYGSATLLTFPGLVEVGSFDLPPQEQGEGLAVGRDGRILLSSEGRESTVLEVALPAELRSALEAASSPSPAGPATADATASGSPSGTARPPPEPVPADDGAPFVGSEPWGRRLLSGGAVALGVGAVISGARARRRP